MPETLDAIGLRHGTDKASSHHNYLSFYEAFMAPLRDAADHAVGDRRLSGRLAEDLGASIFRSAKIIGVDIEPDSK